MAAAAVADLLVHAAASAHPTAPAMAATAVLRVVQRYPGEDSFSRQWRSWAAEEALEEPDTQIRTYALALSVSFGRFPAPVTPPKGQRSLYLSPMTVACGDPRPSDLLGHGVSASVR